MAGNEFWSERCLDLLLSLTPHLFLFVFKRLEKKRRLERRREVKSKPKLMDLLPQDAVENILLRLPTESLCRIRCASKTLSTMIDSPLFAALHWSRLLYNSNSSGMNSVPQVPRLMLCYESTSRLGTSELRVQSLKYNAHNHDLDKINSYSLPISKLLLGTIYELEFVFYNLIFFKRYRPCFFLNPRYLTPCFLLNPLRGEVLEIPTTGIYYKHQQYFYGMGFDDTSCRYKLVCVNMDPRPIPSRSWPRTYRAVTYIYVLGETSCSWREIQAVPPDLISSKNICAHGDMHWIVYGIGGLDVGGRSHIITFDFKKEDFFWTPHPTLRIGDNLYRDGQLLNFRGSMALVDTSFSSKCVSIWVMKDYEKKEWALDYKISVAFPHTYNWKEDHTCGEWNNGIFLVQTDDPRRRRADSVCHFLDIEHSSVRLVQNAWSGLHKIVFSYTPSLISLKKFGSLVPETEANTWDCVQNIESKIPY